MNLADELLGKVAIPIRRKKTREGPRGGGRPKLDAKRVQRMKALRALGVNFARLGAIFGVSENSVGLVVHGKVHRNVAPPSDEDLYEAARVLAEFVIAERNGPSKLRRVA
jgi:hypothetical protein